MRKIYESAKLKITVWKRQDVIKTSLHVEESTELVEIMRVDIWYEN